MNEIRPIIIGTAGHIDHGKSSLVRSLTGVDPDRLAEERARGMTIDLGFAPYRHRSGALVGMIDVPGHERFVRNMVAGASSVDLVLLAVAADDGVMPQTREHLAILRLLGVGRGLVALTKVDLVDPAGLTLALDDVAQWVAGSFLADAPVVPVSCVTGEGLDRLRDELDGLIDRTTPHAAAGSFRLPVQRVFSARGHGLVAAGVPVSGEVRAGDALEIVRSGQPVRVRAVQAHGVLRERGQAGHSTALNLVGASLDDLARGDVIATPGAFRAARFLAIRCEVESGAALDRARAVRVHVGTAEIQGQAVPLAGGPGERDPIHVQLRLDEPVCCAVGDRVLLRDQAGLSVLGGGTVLALGDGRLKRDKPRVLDELRARQAALGDPVRLAQAIVEAAGTRGVNLADLARQCGLAPHQLAPRLDELLRDRRLVAAGTLLLAPRALAQAGDLVVEAVERWHRARPLLDWGDQAAVAAGLSLSPAVIGAVLETDGRLELGPGGRVRRRGHRGEARPEVARARDAILDALRAGGLLPPPVDAALTGLGQADSDALLASLRQSGEAVLVGGVHFHREALERLRRTVVEHAARRQGAIDIPSLRDELGTTRKFLIPLLEALDAEGLTVRHGDRRMVRRPAGPSA